MSDGHAGGAKRRVLAQHTLHEHADRPLAWQPWNQT